MATSGLTIYAWSRGGLARLRPGVELELELRRRSAYRLSELDRRSRF